MPPAAPRRALVFANGDLKPGAAVAAALNHAPDALIIAADGGARLAQACDRPPDLVVGDLDSLAADEAAGLRARGAAFDAFPAAKDETDLELALLAAVKRGATWLRIIGATGDRLDQTLANIYLLLLDQLAGCDARLVAADQTLWVIGPGDHALMGDPGDTISLLPLLGDAHGIHTTRLEYPLRGDTLYAGPARGVSNMIAAASARVSLTAGRLVVVHTAGRA